jgi:hypothetical protein
VDSSLPPNDLQKLRTARVVDLIAIARQIGVSRCPALSAQKSAGDYSNRKAECARHVWVGVDLDFHAVPYSVKADVVQNRRKHTDNSPQESDEGGISLFLRRVRMYVHYSVVAASLA